MIDSRLRSLYQKALVDPILSSPIVSKFTPTTVTFLGLLFGILTAPLLALGLNSIAILSLLISGFLDTLDGSLARAQKSSSPTGAAFDITADRVVEFSVLFGLLLVDTQTRTIPCFFMLGSALLCTTTFLVVGIFSNNYSEKSFHYSPGLIERSEAFIFWAAMMVFPPAFFFLALTFSFLVCLTAGIRLFQFSKRWQESL